MLGELTPGIKKAFKLANDAPATWKNEHILADAIVNQLAAKLKAEFWQKHQVYTLVTLSSEGTRMCGQCGAVDFNVLDRGHEFTDADWLAEAERILTTG